MLDIIYMIMMAKLVESSLVMTKSGPVQGMLMRKDDVFFYVYQGIPYAESPVGDLRFKPPVPKRPWFEILDATKERHICPQPVVKYKKIQMSEDCLFLNIYVPAKKTQLLPILVMLHGGAFTFNSGNFHPIYGPQLFLERGVVVILLNHRLGALGYLSLGIEEATGNAGLKDVLLALNWIKENIESFGGDSNKVTLCGQCSGAAMIHYLQFSKRSQGLFQQVVLLSGSASSYKFLSRYPKDIAFKLARKLGIETNDTYELLQKLREVDEFDLITAQTALAQGDVRAALRPFSVFIPSIEIDTSHAVITENPRKTIKSGILQNVPTLAGFNTDEALTNLVGVALNPKRLTYLNENPELLIPSDIEYPYGSNESKDLATSIRQFYWNGTDVSGQNILDFVKLASDTQFIYGINSWIRTHKARNGSSAVYHYEFGFDGELNWSKLYYNIPLAGTAHADELGYLFETSVTQPKLKSIGAGTKRVKDAWLTFVTNFIKFGNPSSDTGLDSFNWPDYGINHEHMLITDPLEVKNTFSADLTARLKFWDKVYDQYEQYVNSGGRIMNKSIP